MIVTCRGIVKKTALSAYSRPKQGGIIAINLRENDELVSAMLVNDDDELLLVSRQGMSLRFQATEASLRSMGRSTSGVIGMKFRDGDELLSASVANDDGYVFVVTEGGYAKRTQSTLYRAQHRGGKGIKGAQLRGDDVVEQFFVIGHSSHKIG